MNNETIIVGCIIILIVVLFTYHNNKCLNHSKNSEPFENKSSNNLISNTFIKFGETHLKSKSGKEGKYENSTLDQCQFKCSEDDNCIGFVRKDISKDSKDDCYIRVADDVGDCHSLRKGNPEQRMDANAYNTYLKATYLEDNKKKNILTRCLGDETLTLNKKIYIQSIAKPSNCLCVVNNNIKAQQFNNKGVDFFRYASFTIVKGLEGSGTVSFKLKDNNNDDYYLSANNDLNILELVALQIENTNQKERSNASFELHDDPLNKGYVSIKTFSPNNDSKYVSLVDNANNIKNPKIILKKNLDKNISKEYASFNIVNYYTNNSITNSITNNNTTNNKTNNNTNNKTNNNTNNKNTKEVFQSTKSTKYNINPVVDAIILVDYKDNKLMIPARNKVITYENLLDYTQKLNEKKMPPSSLAIESKLDNRTKEELKYLDNLFDLNHINYVLISNNEKHSVRLYNYDFTKKSQSGSHKNIFNYENEINKIGTEIKQLFQYNLEQLKDLAKFHKIDPSNKIKEELYLEILKKIGIDKGITLSSNKDISKLSIEDPDYEKEQEELRKEINLGHYFRIKSIQVFDVNPKTSFDSKINQLEPGFVKKKMDFLKLETSNTDDIVAGFSKYNNNKEKELNMLKDMSIERELDLISKKNELEQNITNLLAEGEKLKLQKIAKDYFFMNQNKL